MKRPAGASCARFSKLTRRRGEGLRRNPPAEAPRIALFWPAAPGATCAPREGGRRACRCPRGAPRGLFRASCVPSAPRRSTHRKIFSKIVLASAGEFPYSTFSHGGVAQLGERLTGSQEVRGSIPLVSTIVNKCKGLRNSEGLFSCQNTTRCKPHLRQQKVAQFISHVCT